MADLKAIAEELVNLTVKEVNELATILKEEYGIEPAAAAVAVAAGPAAGGAEAGAEEKTDFDVILKSAGAAKLLKEYKKEGIPALKAAYAEEGFFVGADKLEELVSIKSKNELIADVVAMLQAPLQGVISGVDAGATIHGLLDAVAERNN